MSNTPDVPTNWEMWDDIEESLDKKGKRNFLPVLFGLPLILLLGGLIGYWLAPKSGDRLSIIDEAIRDTIYINTAIASIDTVVKIEYVTKWKYRDANQVDVLRQQARNLERINQSMENSLADLTTKLDEYRNAFSVSVLRNNPKYKHLDYFNSSLSKIPNDDNAVAEVLRMPVENIAFRPTVLPVSLDYSRPRIMLISDLWFDNLVKNKKSESLFEKMIPDYINVGLSVEGPGLTFTKSLSTGLEFGGGVNVELLFSPKFSLITGLRKRTTSNKTEDEIIAQNYPQPMISIEDVFDKLDVKSSFLDVPLTLKYKILNHNQNTIYLTGGILLSNHSQTEFVYEYKRNSSEIYYEEKVEGQGWNLGSSIVGIGYELEPWNNTSAFIETYARYNFNNELNPVHGIGFRFGLYYKI